MAFLRPPTRPSSFLRRSCFLQGHSVTNDQHPRHFVAAEARELASLIEEMLALTWLGLYLKQLLLETANACAIPVWPY